MKKLTIQQAVYFTVTPLALVAFFLYAPVSWEWQHIFRPAAWSLLQGKSPYSVPGFFNPPWTMLVFVPLALLPERLGGQLLILVNLAGYAYALYRLGARGLAILSFILSPLTLVSVLTNLEGLIALGIVLPPELGLFLIFIKPQITLPLALFWTIQAFREGGVRKALHILWPVALVGGLSLAIFGLWPLQILKSPIPAWNDAAWNASLWPISLVIGLPLLGLAFLRSSKRLAVALGPCFSPYVAPYSYTISLLTLAHRTRWIVAFSLGLWAAYFLARMLYG